MSLDVADVDAVLQSIRTSDVAYQDGDYLCTVHPIWLSTPLHRYHLWQQIRTLYLMRDEP